MSKKYVIPIFVLLVVILLNSCSSIYGDLPDISEDFAVEVDPNEEYFTSGELVLTSNENDGLIYKNYWVYFEDQDYKRYVRTLSNGEKVYVDDSVRRLVKLNTDTGIVSSVCLDPVCNHSPGSDCFVLVPKDASFWLIDFIVGDWVVFSYQELDSKNTVFWTFRRAYNMQTGESAIIAESDLSISVITKTGSFVAFDNKLYYVKSILDYSNTDYDPTSDDPMSDYDPETQSILCEFDFSTLKHTELYEIPEGYYLSAVTNKRFFFSTKNDGAYSCNRDGSNMKKEANLTFSAEGFCGVFAYAFDKKNNTVKIYNLRSDKVTPVRMEHYDQEPVLTQAGILYSTYSTSDQKKDVKGWTATMKLRHEGTALIYLMGFTGNNHKLIYENKDLGVIAHCASDNYLYAWVTDYDPVFPEANHNYMGAERCIIDRSTGEIIPVPLLDLVLVEE